MLRGGEGWAMAEAKALEEALSALLFFVWCGVMATVIVLALGVWAWGWLKGHWYRHCSICQGSGVYTDCIHCPGHIHDCHVCSGTGKVKRWL
jgi:hypothetical protein